MDDVVKEIDCGDVAIIYGGMKHSIKEITELHINEVQIGEELTEEDIERLDWEWE